MKLTKEEQHEPFFMTWGRIRILAENIDIFGEKWTNREEAIKRLHLLCEKFNKDMDSQKGNI